MTRCPLLLPRRSPLLASVFACRGVFGDNNCGYAAFLVSMLTALVDQAWGGARSDIAIR